MCYKAQLNKNTMVSLTKDEAQVAWIALTFSAKKNQAGGYEQRNFPMAQWSDAAHTTKEIKSKCVDDKDLFKDGELDFKTDHKKLILGCLDREWPAVNLEAVMSLKAKLEV